MAYKRLLLLVVGALFLGGAHAQATLAGATLGSKIYSRTMAEFDSFVREYFNMTDITVGPLEFDVLTYDGNVTISDLNDYLNYILNDSESGYIAEMNAFNQMRQAKGPVNLPASGWVRSAECVRKVNKDAKYYWYTGNANQTLGYGYSATDLGPTTGSVPTYYAYSTWGQPWTDMSGGKKWGEVCAPTADVLTFYFGDGVTIDSHDELLIGEMYNSIGGWIEKYDSDGVYNPPPGISHLPDLDAQTASTPVDGGQDPTDTTDPTDPTTTVDPNNPWEVAPGDDQTQCSIVNIPCNLRKLFIPQIDWAAEWQEMKDVMATKIPFAYVMWLNGAQSATPQDLGFSPCAPIQFDSLTLDICGSPVVQWWRNYGVNLAFAVLYLGYLMQVIQRIRS